MKLERCLCQDIVALQKKLSFTKLKHELLILMHYKEARLPSNTGRLTQLLLPSSCRVETRGEPSSPNDSQLDPSRAILIYPTEQSLELPRHNSEFQEILSKRTPAQLVFPDGSWRQASKVHKRVEALKSVPAFHLGEEQAPTQYRLRREPKAGGLATFEAIARILGMIEGPEVQKELESFFDLFVKHSLATRAGHQ